MKTREELHKIIDKRKEKLLGKEINAKFDGVLPFLPKVGDNHAGPQTTDAGCSLGTVDSKGTAIADPSE